mgnify:CR=1 FL=1
MNKPIKKNKKEKTLSQRLGILMITFFALLFILIIRIGETLK